MVRRLSAEERALWHKVARSVRPLAPRPPVEPAETPPSEARALHAAPAPRTRPGPSGPGSTLDAGWDRRLARGLARPDRVVDLHGHGLAAAHALLEARLDEAGAAGARLLLLITGRPPRGEARPHGRGVIRASIGDWLAASPRAADIAAIRAAHPRHGGAGALYLVLRRRRG